MVQVQLTNRTSIHYKRQNSKKCMWFDPLIFVCFLSDKSTHLPLKPTNFTSFAIFPYRFIDLPLPQ